MVKLTRSLGHSIINTRRFTLLLSAMLFCLLLPGCVSVPVWERGNLAKDSMSIDPNPLQSDFQAHNYSSRESAPSHKSSSGGGGCGCY